ncbi:anthranilate synthase / indole-3-glycerol phosphate synthase [Vanrija albida]|uniref:Multifunctional tryptophan biosynthesis protein n=1 Tax=Vanrija albida TaxID=181172 RepID=A0ABR3PU23_9TREE
MPHTLLIDNYDSFTWNVYADLATLGGNPLVVRNDKITLPEIEAMYAKGEIDRVVISPGPGHPRTDSGISRDVITWATGKVPVLGVCMGLECIVDVLGGEIAYAGEIKHGKTSLVKHDARGIFHDLPPLLASTRYHSLAAKLLTLPPILAVTSTTEESGVIMGVRHRTHTVEAVQYHPESCMSEGGQGLFANFLKLKGGNWGGENAWCGVEAAAEGSEPATSNGTAAKSAGQPSVPSILNKIKAQRLSDVEDAKATLATTPANVAKSIKLHAAPPLISFVDRLKSTPHTAVLAEVKRASPSKGDIAPETSAPEQALRYAAAGASVISVLTEPTWFKGTLGDMLAVRQAVDSMPNRPAILRKDFILAPYQIDEARLNGADTVLLIVAMLSPAKLKELYDYSVSLGMEPLVEVNNPAELEVALEVGSKVIGVNNRNLHDFNVDMSTTSRVNDAVKGRDVILIALSGIASAADVEKYVAEGVKAVLVGESLMRAPDAGAFLRELIGLEKPAPAPARRPLVKICGIRTPQDAQAAIDAGADLLGVILVPGTKRHVEVATARAIADVVRAARSKAERPAPAADPTPLWFGFHAKRLRSRRLPLLVGVVRNQPLEDVANLVDDIGLDVVQLHGDEPQTFARQLPVPVIKAFRVEPDGSVRGGQASRPGLNEFVLLDAPAAGGGAGGGEGVTFDWSVAKRIVDAGEVGAPASPLPILLAGGLKPDNVATAIDTVGSVLAVDVASGVEGADGFKDAALLKAFVKAVKGQ